MINETTAKQPASNAVVGYQVAMSLATFYAQMVWFIFSAMIVANSIVIAALTSLAKGNATPQSLSVLISIAGLILCFCWFLMVKRAHDYAGYYTLSARELEEKFLSPDIQTISRGAIFSEGSTVHIHLSGTPVQRRFSKIATLARGENASYPIIGVFAVLYCIIIYKSSWGA